MAQQVTLPDGRVLEFPDGMSRQDMSAAIQRLLDSEGAPTPPPVPTPDNDVYPLAAPTTPGGPPPHGVPSRYRLGGLRENLIGEGAIDTPGEYFGNLLNRTGTSFIRGAAKTLGMEGPSMPSPPEAGTLTTPPTSGVDPTDPRFRLGGWRENLIGDDVIDTPGEYLGNMIKEGETALLRGTLGLVGLPGTMGDLLDSLLTNGVNKIAGKEVIAPPDKPSSLSSEGLVDALSKTTGGWSDRMDLTRGGSYVANVGEFLPGVAAFGGADPATLLKYGAAPAITSEFAGNKFAGSPWEPAVRFGTALATPAVINGVSNLARRIVTPNPATAEAAAAAQVLDRNDVRLTAGQRTGSGLQKADEQMTKTGLRLTGQAEDDFTRAALRSVGVDGNRATPEVLGDVSRRLGAEFDSLIAQAPIQPDKTLLDDVARAVTNYESSVGTSARAPRELAKLIETRATSGQPIALKDYQFYRTELDRLANSREGFLRDAARAIRAALDDALARTIQQSGDPQLIDRWATARQQWQNFLILRRAVNTNTADGVVGQITPSRLASAAKAVLGESRWAAPRGEQHPLSELARSGVTALTAPRGPELAVRTRNLASSLGGGGTLGSLTYAITRDPSSSAVAAALGTYAPALGRRLGVTPFGQAYLANQLFPNSAQPVTRQGMTALLAALAAQNAQSTPPATQPDGPQ